MTQLENATFNNTNVKTHIAILHEAGHPKPWIIAMDCLPSKYKILDYSMRWGIKCLFSDFKSRGFSITKTHLVHPDRIERLTFVLTIAPYWAVSTGIQPIRPILLKKLNRALVSWFKNGLKILLKAIITLSQIPNLWPHINSLGC